MAQIESKKVQVSGSVNEIYDFLIQMENIKLLLPQDKISNWSSTENTCTFKIQNMYTFTLERNQTVLNASDAFILFNTSEDSPFSFTLKANIEANGDHCTCWQFCDANINPFMEIMVKGPLQSLFDYMAERLQKMFQQEQ
jgi:hypothetical protein